MQACRAALQAPVSVVLGRPGAGRCAARSAPTSARPRLLVAPGAGLAQQHTAGQRQLSVAAAAKAGGGGGSGGGGTGGTKRGRDSHTPDPQPELQAWLEQTGLGPADADNHARRLARVFGGDQQAALASLPATFAFCGSRGLTGPQTAKLLDGIAKNRHENVVSFAATVQVDWQLIEPYIAAHVQRLQQAGKRQPKHTSLAILLCDTKGATRMLTKPPGHVADWLAAVSRQLPYAADVGSLLLTSPLILTTTSSTPVAVLRWAVKQLGVPREQLAAFAAKAPALLAHDPQSLQANLAVLQEVLPPQQAQQQARDWPRLLITKSETVRAAQRWLQWQFGGDAERLHAVLKRAPHLLTVSALDMQQRASFLQRQHGWRRDDGQLAAWIEAHPRPFAAIDFGSADKQALLLLCTGVLGVALADCLGRWSQYLGVSLGATAARYVLVQERAPRLLYGQDGRPQLSWATHAPKQLIACGAATKAEVQQFEKTWPQSEQGQRLLAALRSGSTEGWPRPPSWEEAEARRPPQRKDDATEEGGGTAQ